MKLFLVPSLDYHLYHFPPSNTLCTLTWFGPFGAALASHINERSQLFTTLHISSL